MPLMLVLYIHNLYSMIDFLPLLRFHIVYIYLNYYQTLLLDILHFYMLNFLFLRLQKMDLSRLS